MPEEMSFLTFEQQVHRGLCVEFILNYQTQLSTAGIDMRDIRCCMNSIMHSA